MFAVLDAEKRIVIEMIARRTTTTYD